MRAVNLLPKDEAGYGHKSAPLPLLIGVGLAVIITVALCASYLSANGDVTARKQQRDDLIATRDALPAPPQRSQANATSGLTAEQQARVSAVGQALSRRIVWDRLLREISQVLPEDVWLQSLSAKSPLAATSAVAAAPVAGAEPTGFTLSGYTYSQDGVARVLARIQTLPDLTNVQLQKSSTSEVGTRTVVGFTILADVRAPGGAS